MYASLLAIDGAKSKLNVASTVVRVDLIASVPCGRRS